MTLCFKEIKKLMAQFAKQSPKKQLSKKQTVVDSSPRVPFDLTLQFNDLIQLVINEDGKNNPKNRPNYHQHGKNCHEYGDHCSAKNFGKRRNYFIPVDDEQRNEANEHEAPGGDNPKLQFPVLRLEWICRRSARHTSGDVKLCLDTACGADNDPPCLCGLKFEVGRAVVANAFDEHFYPFQLAIWEMLSQNRTFNQFQVITAFYARFFPKEPAISASCQCNSRCVSRHQLSAVDSICPTFGRKLSP